MIAQQDTLESMVRYIRAVEPVWTFDDVVRHILCDLSEQGFEIRVNEVQRVVRSIFTEVVA